MLYFLIVNYQSYSLVERFVKNFSTLSSLESHESSLRISHQILIINNFPPEQNQLEQLRTDTVQVIASNQNLGFGRACNLGLRWIYQRHPQALVWLINPDTYCDPITKLAVGEFFHYHPEVSILGTLIYSLDNQVWFFRGTFFPLNGTITSDNGSKLLSLPPYFSCDWVSGCSMIINFSNFKKCPQFDLNYFLYYEDFDFCQRYKKEGHLVAVTDQIHIIHEVSTITNRNLQKKFYHSTYSYLFTLERYTHKTIFYMRLTRLLIYALLLLPVKPSVALGKITGAWHYLQKRLSGVTPFID